MKLDKEVNILVIDDEELICWSLKHTFEKMDGYHVNCAYTGNDAIDKLNKNRYDIVITDLNLPDINNFEIVKEIRMLASNTPVIVISAHLSEPFYDEFKKQGVYKCINKPFDLSYVLGEVKEAVAYNCRGTS